MLSVQIRTIFFSGYCPNFCGIYFYAFLHTWGVGGIPSLGQNFFTSFVSSLRDTDSYLRFAIAKFFGHSWIFNPCLSDSVFPFVTHSYFDQLPPLTMEVYQQMADGSVALFLSSSHLCHNFFWLAELTSNQFTTYNFNLSTPSAIRIGTSNLRIRICTFPSIIRNHTSPRPSYESVSYSVHHTNWYLTDNPTYKFVSLFI